MKEYFFRLTKDEDATVFENHSKNISYGFPLCCLLYLFLKCCSLQTMRFFGAIFKHCVNDGEKKKFSPITKTVNSWWNAKPWLRTTETSWTLTAFGSWTDHHLCESALVTEQVSGLPSTAKVASAEANVEDWSAGLRRATLGNPIHDKIKRKCKLAFFGGERFSDISLSLFRAVIFLVFLTFLRFVYNLLRLVRCLQRMPKTHSPFSSSPWMEDDAIRSTWRAK